MTSRQAFILRLSVIWTVWVWVVLIRNMITDHSAGWGFRLTHIGLAIVSLAFAGAIWYVTGRARRFTKEVDRGFRYRPLVGHGRPRGGPVGGSTTDRGGAITVNAPQSD